jgi:hypothetical protein
MGFIMSNDAKKFFNKLNESKHGRFQYQFDFYYLCLIAGLINETPSECKGEEFFDEFPSGFVLQREQIIGLLIATQIKRDKIDVENRDRLERLMLKLVQPDSPTRLSDYGESLMNQYAENGFKRILEKIPLPPTNLDTFLVSYYERVLTKLK